MFDHGDIRLHTHNDTTFHFFVSSSHSGRQNVPGSASQNFTRRSCALRPPTQWASERATISAAESETWSAGQSSAVTSDSHGRWGSVSMHLKTEECADRALRCILNCVASAWKAMSPSMCQRPRVMLWMAGALGPLQHACTCL